MQHKPYTMLISCLWNKVMVSTIKTFRDIVIFKHKKKMIEKIERAFLLASISFGNWTSACVTTRRARRDKINGCGFAEAETLLFWFQIPISCCEAMCFWIFMRHSRKLSYIACCYEIIGCLLSSFQRYSPRYKVGWTDGKADGRPDDGGGRVIMVRFGTLKTKTMHFGSRAEIYLLTNLAKWSEGKFS